MHPPTPTSSLFPYTTLFRSTVGRRRQRPAAALARARQRSPAASVVLDVPHGRRRFWRRAADRKSTRLNSSHLVISYAVFCLKKKIPGTNTLARITHRRHEAV